MTFPLLFIRDLCMCYYEPRKWTRSTKGSEITIGPTKALLGGTVWEEDNSRKTMDEARVARPDEASLRKVSASCAQALIYYEENTRDKTKLKCKTCPADGFH